MKFEFYKVHQSKPFYNDLCSYLLDHRCDDIRGKNAVLANRKLMGATNPKDAEENTIKKLFEFQLIKILFMVLTQLKTQKKK